MTWLTWELIDPIALWTIVVGIAVNVPCALLGCYLVLRKMSLLGDAISHAILPGIVVAFLLTGSLDSWAIFLGALTAGMLTTFLVQTLRSYGQVPEDASMGVVFTALFALGVLLIVKQVGNSDLDPGCVLYGEIGYTPFDTVATGIGEIPRVLRPLSLAGLATIVFIGLFWKELKLTSFDPGLATAMGFSAVGLHYALMGMVATVTVASFEAVGSILVIAMLIVPGATAHLLTDRLSVMLALASLLGITTAVLGYYAAVAAGTTIAGMMAVVSGVQLCLAVVFAPKHGLLIRFWRRIDLATRIAAEDIMAQLYRLGERTEGVIAAGAVPTARASIDLGAARRAIGGGIRARMALGRLRHHGLVEDDPLSSGRRVRLSDRGRRRAMGLVRSHRLWESYLGTHFELPLDHLHEPAERIEHFIDPSLRERLAAELQQPQADPHGQPIPPSPALTEDRPWPNR